MIAKVCKISYIAHQPTAAAAAVQLPALLAFKFEPAFRGRIRSRLALINGNFSATCQDASAFSMTLLMLEIAA